MSVGPSPYMEPVSIKSTDIIRFTDPETGKESVLSESDLVFLAMSSTHRNSADVWLEQEIPYEEEESLSINESRFLKITSKRSIFSGFPDLGETIFINDIPFRRIVETSSPSYGDYISETRTTENVNATFRAP